MDKSDFHSWLPEKIESGKLKWDSWSKYKKYVLEFSGKYSDESISAIDDISTKVVDRMGNPASPKSDFPTYGLLMGDVQSGKTATYTGICHKAIDAGYRFIIVLTGTKDSLRIQTQVRLDKDLRNFQTNSEGHQRQIIDSWKSSYTWRLLTTPENDFNISKLDTSIPPSTSKQVVLAVVKKNSSVLGNLLLWLQNRVNDLGIKSLPCLIIDDEADLASINVSNKNNSPTAINKKIRNILKYFDKAAYLGITATLFANVFIDPQIDEKTGKMKADVLPDLFPRDYIFVLPPPKGYLGAEKLFGDDDETDKAPIKYRTLIRVGSESALQKIKKDTVLEELPNSLKQSILYFLCVCTYRDMTSVLSSNISMLVHISRLKGFHEQLRKLIKQYVKEIQDLAFSASRRSCSNIENNEIYCQLKDIWSNGCRNELWYTDNAIGPKPLTLKELSHKDWSLVWRENFAESVKKIKIEKINSDNKIKSMEEFYEKNDARLIAVGGDALSRGLTLEGLCVTYFFRNSVMYDSLLQMGRWFGYRGRDADIMKIWISDPILESFRYITQALSEFRQTLDTMIEKGKTPEQFGLKIRMAPPNVKLMVTAANKRRTVKEIQCYEDISGPQQAATFPIDEATRKFNMDCVSDFLLNLGPSQRGYEAYPNIKQGKDLGSTDLVWKSVPAARVATLLRNFKVYSWTNNIDIYSAADKIEQMNKEWDVRVVSRNEDGKYQPEFEDVFNLGKNIICSRRTLKIDGDHIECDNDSKNIYSPEDFARHWSVDQRSTLKKALPSKKLTARAVLSREGEKPQLLIYPVRTLHQDDDQTHYYSDQPLVSLIIGIPDDGNPFHSSMKVKYSVNKIEQLIRSTGYHNDPSEEDDEEIV